MSILIRKFFTALILPPGFFILGFLFLAFLLRHHKLGRTVALLLGGGLYLLAIEPGKDLILYPLEKFYPLPSLKELQGEVVVVLSGGTRDTGYPEGDSVIRMLEGIRIARQRNLPLLISGGVVLHQRRAASRVLEEFLSPFLSGITVYTEPHSRDTRENALFTALYLKELGIKKVILVTSAYHLPRATMLFRREGLDVLPYPTDFKREARYGPRSFLPRHEVLSESAKGIKEYLGIALYAFLS